ncbi:phosphatase PAP2 family protein [Paenibacillus humicola]|uniref:phosphatase PAP2 family protein n=1 Tax=Paenibacillus humicola TaxID=3110540 RepID=UPI00237B4FA5|nr:phosphatase PAP2 family protein [Paenibacillus humicola]
MSIRSKASPKHGRRLFIACLTLAAFGAGFLITAASVRTYGFNRFDAAVIARVAILESPGETLAMKAFSWIGSGIGICTLALAVTALLCKLRRRLRGPVFFLAVFAGAELLDPLLKAFYHRTRPDMHRLIPITGYSFPSGHAMDAAACCGALAFLLWRAARGRAGRAVLVTLCLLMTAAIGISRIYLGVHYPSDVLGGYLAGGAWLSLAILIDAAVLAGKKRRHPVRIARFPRDGTSSN